jgi:hypothetical protein
LCGRCAGRCAGRWIVCGLLFSAAQFRCGSRRTSESYETNIDATYRRHYRKKRIAHTNIAMLVPVKCVLPPIAPASFVSASKTISWWSGASCVTRGLLSPHSVRRRELVTTSTWGYLRRIALSQVNRRKSPRSCKQGSGRQTPSKSRIKIIFAHYGWGTRPRVDS